MLLEQLSLAKTAIQEANKYDAPQNNSSVSALNGIIALRRNDRPIALEAFNEALKRSQEVLQRNSQSYGAWETLGLAECGLAACRNDGDFGRAIAAYAEARKINRELGIVNRASTLLKTLAPIAGMKPAFASLCAAAEGR